MAAASSLSVSRAPGAPPITVLIELVIRVCAATESNLVNPSAPIRAITDAESNFENPSAATTERTDAESIVAFAINTFTAAESSTTGTKL